MQDVNSQRKGRTLRAYGEIAFATIAGGVSDDGSTELFSATITPPGTDPAGTEHGCICDIEVLSTDLTTLTATLAAQGIEYEVFNAEPPFQTITIDFGLTTVSEVITRLITLFETDDLRFDNPQYWIRFDDNPATEPEMIVTDVLQLKHQTLVISQNLSSARTVSHPAITLSQWQAYCDKLETLTIGGDEEPFFIEIVAGRDFIEGTVNPAIAQAFASNMLTLAHRFPNPSCP